LSINSNSIGTLSNSAIFASNTAVYGSNVGGTLSKAITVNSSNYVGINTSTPSYNLDINGTVNASYGIHIPGYNGYLINDNFDTGNSNNYGLYMNSGITRVFAAGAFPGSALALSLSTGLNTFSDLLYINHSGQVGINTTSPSYTLDVNGPIHSDSGLVINSSTYTDTSLNAWSNNIYNTSNAAYFASNKCVSDSNVLYGEASYASNALSNYLPKSGGTITSTSDYTLQILNSNTNGISTYSHPLNMLNSALSYNESYIVQIGQADNLNNAGYIGFVYQSNSSVSNYMTIGLFDDNRVLNITGNGYVGINTTSP